MGICWCDIHRPPEPVNGFLRTRQQSAPVKWMPSTINSVRRPRLLISSTLRKGYSKECSHNSVRRKAPKRARISAHRDLGISRTRSFIRAQPSGLSTRYTSDRLFSNGAASLWRPSGRWFRWHSRLEFAAVRPSVSFDISQGLRSSWPGKYQCPRAMHGKKSHAWPTKGYRVRCRCRRYGLRSHFSDGGCLRQVGEHPGPPKFAGP